MALTQGPADVTPDALSRTRTHITRGIWVCAGLAMAGSALTGSLTFRRLNEFWGAGLATAIAVDVALWVVLTGDRQLGAIGHHSGWKGRALRIITALMSGTLNCGFSLLAGEIFLAVLHGFLPILLIGLTEYAGLVDHAITAAVAQARQEVQRAAAVDVVVAAPTVPAPPPIGWSEEKIEGQPASEHIREGDNLPTQSRSLLNPLGSATTPTTKTPLRLVSPESAAARRGRVAAAAIAWLTDQHRRGVDTTTITPAQLAQAIGGKIDTCRRNLDEWCAAATREVVA